MEYFKTSEYYTRIDVYFDGEKYVFINAFLGIVAIARRDYIDFTRDENPPHSTFNVEKTKRTVSNQTIEKLIKKQESRYVKVLCKFHYKEVEEESLPYFISVKLDKRG